MAPAAASPFRAGVPRRRELLAGLSLAVIVILHIAGSTASSGPAAAATGAVAATEDRLGAESCNLDTFDGIPVAADHPPGLLAAWHRYLTRAPHHRSVIAASGTPPCQPTWNASSRPRTTRVRAPQLHGPYCSDEFCLFIGTTFHPKKKSQWVPRVVVFERELRPSAATTVTAAVDRVFTCSPICDLTCHNIDRATGRVDLSPPQPGRDDPDSNSGVAADGDGPLLGFEMSDPDVHGCVWRWVQEWSISPHTGRVVKVYEDDGGPCDDDDDDPG